MSVSAFIDNRYLVQKQNEKIIDIIYEIENRAEGYELLSDFPENEAIAMLRGNKISKTLCGVSYFFGVFYLCANQEHKAVVFMVDIEPAPGVKRTIRASASP